MAMLKAVFACLAVVEPPFVLGNILDAQRHKDDEEQQTNGANSTEAVEAALTTILIATTTRNSRRKHGVRRSDPGLESYVTA